MGDDLERGFKAVPRRGVEALRGCIRDTRGRTWLDERSGLTYVKSMITGSPAACITRSTAFRAARGLLLSLAMAAFASAQIPSYNVIDLGTLGGPGAAARGINNGSVVAGQSAVGSHQHAFRWKEVPAIPAPGTVAVLIDLGVLPTALDGDGVNIAPSDTVVGQSNNPVIWEAVAATALPPLGGDDHGNAHAATSRTVVGYLTRYIPGWGIVNSRAVRWRGGKATELHPVDATLSQAFDINRHGHIAGWASATDRKSTRLNSSHPRLSRMPSSA